MIDLLEECQRTLNEASNATTVVETSWGRALAFEGTTVLGFIVAYEDTAQLLDRWGTDTRTLINNHRLSLRRAERKAWNTYTVLLSRTVATNNELVALSSIEEDLRGTRKIARAGVNDLETLRAALLPLLPIQNSPRLEAIDMAEEIKLRTTELPARVVEAFLSGAQETFVLQVLEEEP